VRMSNCLIRITLFGMIAALCIAGSCAGAVPTVMSYQGKLQDAAGQPVSDGDYSFRFFIYDQETNGNLLWQEPAASSDPMAVHVVGGLFTVMLGSTVPLGPEDFTGNSWLAVEVNGSTLAPRTRVASAGYAFTAQTLILPVSSSVNSSSIALSIINQGSGQAGYFSRTGSGGTLPVLEASGSGSAATFKATNGGSGYAADLVGKMRVSGTAEVAGFKMTNSPVAGYVMSSDASGTGTWTAPRTTSGSEVNVKDYGAVGDGVANDTSAINSAIAAIPSTGGVLLFPAGTYSVSSIAFTAKVSARFQAGARLSLGVGAVASFYGTIEAGLYQIFTW
jgi:hypothetical protein